MIVSFGKSRKNEYTAHQLIVMKDMKKAAVKNGWQDIYSGEKFGPDNPPSIEHLIPRSAINSFKVQKMKQKGFQLDGIDNIFPVNSLENSNRQSEAFVKTVLKDPEIINRFIIELAKYSEYKSECINGQEWSSRLYNTALSELEGIASDIKTRKVFLA